MIICCPGDICLLVIPSPSTTSAVHSSPNIMPVPSFTGSRFSYGGKSSCHCKPERGVGKTTTTLSLGAALALRGAKVLLLDLDPHICASVHMRFYPDETTATMFDLFQTQPEKLGRNMEADYCPSGRTDMRFRAWEHTSFRIGRRFERSEGKRSDTQAGTGLSAFRL